MNLRPLVFAATLLALPVAASAQDAPAAAPTTDPVHLRARYVEIVAAPEFREMDERGDDSSLREWVTQWLTQVVTRFQDFKYAGQMSGLAWLLITSLTGVAVVGVIYVLARLARSRGHEVDATSIDFADRRALLSPQAYEAQLRAAVAAGDWHGAWLACWLQFLARLEMRQLVEPDRSRTNREYLAQLRAQPLPEAAVPLLSALVHDYDRCIYGRRAIDETGWNGFRARIEEVALLLHLREGVAAGKTS